MLSRRKFTLGMNLSISYMMAMFAFIRLCAHLTLSLLSFSALSWCSTAEAQSRHLSMREFNIVHTPCM